MDSLRLRLANTRDYFLTHSLGARLAKGVFWSLGSTVVSQGLGLLASIITARLLGKIGFGEFGIINSTVGMLGIFAGLGFGITATKYVAQYRLQDPERVGKILGLLRLVVTISGGLVALALFALAPRLAAGTLNAPHLVFELRLACALLFINEVNGAQTGALAGFEAFRTIAGVTLLRGFLNFPVMIAGVWFFGLPGAVGASVVVAGAHWLLNHLALRRECLLAKVHIAYRGVAAELPLLWQFSLPAFLGSAVGGPATWLANTILVNQPRGYAQMGLLNAAWQWQAMLLFLPSIFQQVALPLLSSTVHDEEKVQDYHKTIVMTQSLTVFIVLPAGAFLMFISDWIMKLYGSGFAEGSPVLMGIICNAMIMSLGGIFGPAIASQGRMWLGFVINLSWGLGLIIVVALLAPSWGAKSVAFGSAISYLVVTIWCFIYLLPSLPEGIVARIFKALGFIVLLTSICYLSSAHVRALLVIPATLISGYLSFAVFTAPNFRERIIKLVHYVKVNN